MLARLARVLGELDPAGLPAAPDLDLGLDHAGVADAVGRGHGLLHTRGHLAGGDGDPVTGEELLALVLEQVHAGREIYNAPR